MGTSLPAIEGWFATEGEPSLLGGRCGACATFTFPRRDGLCPNPHCTGQQVDEVRLSTRGTVWSYATNHYAPPPPAVVTAPYTVVAVTLAEEQLTVLGLLAEGADAESLRVGGEVELVVEQLTTDDDGTVRTIWKWSPVEVAA